MSSRMQDVLLRKSTESKLERKKSCRKNKKVVQLRNQAYMTLFLVQFFNSSQGLYHNVIAQQDHYELHVVWTLRNDTL